MARIYTRKALSKSARQMWLQLSHDFLCLRFRQPDTEFFNLAVDIKADSAASGFS